MNKYRAACFLWFAVYIEHRKPLLYTRDADYRVIALVSVIAYRN